MKTEETPTLILFDLNETLLDMSPVKEAVNNYFGNENAFQLWFSYLLQYSLVEMITDQYHNFSEVGDATLQMIGNSLGKEISSEERKSILSKMAKLDPHPDVKEGLSLLQEKGYRLATLTNSAEEVAKKQLEHAGLQEFFEARMSVDPMKELKPKLSTYHRALKELGVSAQETLFVAAHGWDITGALRAGLSAAFIARKGKSLYPLATAPSYVGDSLTEIARQLRNKKRK